MDTPDGEREASMNGTGIPVAVVGAGVVGSTLVGHFLRAGYENVAIVDIPERIAQIRDHGIHISKLTSIHVNPKYLFDDVEQLAGQDVQTVIVATKANHLPVIAPKLAKIHEPGMLVISFQNGIGTENFIAKHVDPASVGRVTVNFAGVKNESSGEVAMSWFHPPNFLGPFVEQDLARFQQLGGLLSEVGLETEVVQRQEMKRQVFFKTILNAALNALCATAGLTMTEAMRMRHTRQHARNLLREALSVAAFMGYHYGEDVLEQCMG